MGIIRISFSLLGVGQVAFVVVLIRRVFFLRVERPCLREDMFSRCYVEVPEKNIFNFFTSTTEQELKNPNINTRQWYEDKSPVRSFRFITKSYCRLPST